MPPVALVTGANQGLGLALVRGLARTLAEDAAVYLTARDPERGRAAGRQLESEGLHPRLLALDVTDAASVAAAAQAVHAAHGGVDVVIQNAAARISPDAPLTAQVAGFVATNNHGTTRVIEAFQPLLNDGARFLVMASSFGSTKRCRACVIPTTQIDAVQHAMEPVTGARRWPSVSGPGPELPSRLGCQWWLPRCRHDSLEPA